LDFLQRHQKVTKKLAKRRGKSLTLLAETSEWAHQEKESYDQKYRQAVFDGGVIVRVPGRSASGERTASNTDTMVSVG
jgi:hypothetical protein